jgi:hypothetical protein
MQIVVLALTSWITSPLPDFPPPASVNVTCSIVLEEFEEFLKWDLSVVLNNWLKTEGNRWFLQAGRHLASCSDQNWSWIGLVSLSKPQGLPCDHEVYFLIRIWQKAPTNLKIWQERSSRKTLQIGNTDDVTLLYLVLPDTCIWYFQISKWWKLCCCLLLTERGKMKMKMKDEDDLDHLSAIAQ